ncbi:MAG: RNA helicase [Watsoniomyces obsoletus]|nr:MAG: RNA helicase [Watsoniomyces obsoletus]
MISTDIVLGPPKTSFASATAIRHLTRDTPTSDVAMGRKQGDGKQREDKDDIREKFFRERSRERRDQDKPKRADATDASVPPSRAKSREGRSGATLRPRKSFSNMEAKPTLKTHEDGKANGDGEMSRRQGMDKMNRGPHDQVIRTPAGERDGGARRAGPSRARNEPTWFKTGTAEADKVERTKETVPDPTRKVRDNMGDRNWKRNERREEEPAWMESVRHETTPPAHTAEDFERWKEQMRAGSAPKVKTEQAKEEAVKPDEVEEAEEEPASEKRYYVPPIVMDPALDRFLNPRNPRNGNGEAGARQGDGMGPAVRMNPVKPSRFMGLFAAPDPPSSGIAGPSLAAEAEASGTERKGSVQATPEDKQGFLQIMEMLRSTNLQGEKDQPLMPMPEPNVEGQQIQTSSAMHQEGPSDRYGQPPITRAPVTSAESAFQGPYGWMVGQQDPMQGGTQDVNEPHNSGHVPTHAMTPRPTDFGPFLPGSDMVSPSHRPEQDRQSPERQSELDVTEALNMMRAAFRLVTLGGDVNVMAPYTQAPSPPKMDHPFTQGPSPPNVMPEYTQGPGPQNVMDPFPLGPSPPPVSTTYGAPPATTTAYGAPPGLYGGPIGPGPQPMGPPAMSMAQQISMPQSQVQMPRPSDDITQGAFPPMRGTFARPPGLDPLPMGWSNNTQQLPGLPQPQQQPQRGMPAPPGLGGQENNNNNPNGRGGPNNQPPFFSTGPPGLGYQPGSLPRAMGPPGLNPNMPPQGFFNGPHAPPGGGPPGPVPSALGAVGLPPPAVAPGYPQQPMGFHPNQQQQNHHHQNHQQQGPPSNMMPPSMLAMNTSQLQYPGQPNYGIPVIPNHLYGGNNVNLNNNQTNNHLPPTSMAGGPMQQQQQGLRGPPSVTAGPSQQQQHQMSQFPSHQQQQYQHQQGMLPLQNQYQQHQQGPSTMRFPFVGPDGGPGNLPPPNVGLGFNNNAGGGPPMGASANLQGGHTQGHGQLQGQVQGQGNSMHLPGGGTGHGIGPLGPLGPPGSFGQGHGGLGPLRRN